MTTIPENNDEFLNVPDINPIAPSHREVHQQTDEVRRSIDMYKREINNFLADLKRDVIAKNLADKTKVIRHFTTLEGRLAGVENKVDKSINELQAKIVEMQVKTTTNIWAVVIPAIMAAITAISVAYFNRGDINTNKAIISEQQTKLNELQKDANKLLERDR